MGKKKIFRYFNNAYNFMWTNLDVYYDKFKLY